MNQPSEEWYLDAARAAATASGVRRRQRKGAQRCSSRSRILVANAPDENVCEKQQDERLSRRAKLQESLKGALLYESQLAAEAQRRARQQRKREPVTDRVGCLSGVRRGRVTQVGSAAADTAARSAPTTL